MSCAKIVKASWPDGSTITSKVSAVAIRNSSTVTGCTYWPSAATTVIFRPGMRTSKWLIAEPLMKRSRTLSPDRKDRKSTTSELQSLMRISYAVFCLKKKQKKAQTEKDTVPHSHNK